MLTICFSLKQTSLLNTLWGAGPKAQLNFSRKQLHLAYSVFLYCACETEALYASRGLFIEKTVLTQQLKSQNLTLKSTDPPS